MDRLGSNQFKGGTFSSEIQGSIMAERPRAGEPRSPGGKMLTEIRASATPPQAPHPHIPFRPRPGGPMALSPAR